MGFQPFVEAVPQPHEHFLRGYLEERNLAAWYPRVYEALDCIAITVQGRCERALRGSRLHCVVELAVGSGDFCYQNMDRHGIQQLLIPYLWNKHRYSGIQGVDNAGGQQAYSPRWPFPIQPENDPLLRPKIFLSISLASGSISSTLRQK